MRSLRGGLPYLQLMRYRVSYGGNVQQISTRYRARVTSCRINKLLFTVVTVLVLKVASTDLASNKVTISESRTLPTRKHDVASELTSELIRVHHYPSSIFQRAYAACMYAMQKIKASHYLGGEKGWVGWMS